MLDALGDGIELRLRIASQDERSLPAFVGRYDQFIRRAVWNGIFRGLAVEMESLPTTVTFDFSAMRGVHAFDNDSPMTVSSIPEGTSTSPLTETGRDSSRVSRIRKTLRRCDFGHSILHGRLRGRSCICFPIRTGQSRIRRGRDAIRVRLPNPLRSPFLLSEPCARFSDDG